ncbi:hypothetical protein, partial [Escherichia coli]|uniref:hypothetical protein n=1 Tax=Escherichia coli TaxID=562 RepID=UPI001C58810F
APPHFLVFVRMYFTFFKSLYGGFPMALKGKQRFPHISKDNLKIMEFSINHLFKSSEFLLNSNIFK